MFLTFLIKLLWNGFSARDLVHTMVWPRPWSATGCFGKCKSSILSAFSQDNKAYGFGSFPTTP